MSDDCGMLNRVMTVISLATVIAAVAGCGGGADFASRANEVCAEFTQQDSAETPGSVAEAMEIEHRMLAKWGDAVDRLGGLEPPKEWLPTSTPVSPTNAR